MGMLMSCLFTPPKDVIDPVITENRVVIIAEDGEAEDVRELMNVLEEHDIPEDDIKILVIENNCSKGGMLAHLEEMTGAQELPYVTMNGENLGTYSEIMEMTSSGSLYRAIHGKDRDEVKTVKPERRPSLAERFFGGGGEKKKQKKRKQQSTTEITEEVVEETIEVADGEQVEIEENKA